MAWHDRRSQLGSNVDLVGFCLHCSGTLVEWLTNLSRRHPIALSKRIAWEGLYRPSQHTLRKEKKTRACAEKGSDQYACPLFF